ncbi:MAG: segregation/condensation protein A, partial [Oscillospiraceae bacterium]
DLMLALISKNKMNIYDIEIVSLIDQYLQIVNNAENASMDAESEFIEMAARLIYMKSVFLLPRADEQERLRDELTGILIEYSACKVVATKLKTMAEGVYFAVRQPAEVELDNTYNILHDVNELERAYTGLMGKSTRKRQPRQEQFDELVSVPFVSVTSRIVFLMRNLMSKKFTKLKDFFKKNSGHSETVATFLAVLELIRAGRVSIDDNEEMSLNRRIDKRVNTNN